MGACPAGDGGQTPAVCLTPKTPPVHTLESRLGGWVITARWPIIAITLVLVGIAASGTAFLELSADYRIYFSEDNPQLLASEAMEDAYGKNSNVFFTVVPEDGDFTSALALEATAWLTEQSWTIPYASRVDSVVNFQHVTADGDEILVRDLVDEADRNDAGERSRIRTIALREPRLVARLIAPDGAVGGVNVTVQMPGKDALTEGYHVAEFARGLRNEVRERFPGIDVRMGGIVIFNQTFTEVSLKDLQTLVPASFVAMTLMLLFLTRGISGTIAVMLVVALSVMTAVGLGGWVGFPMTAATAISPIVVLTVAIANCVHVYSSLTHSMRAAVHSSRGDRNHDALTWHHGTRDLKRDAIVESVRVNLQPVFLASLTTALGFLSMNFSEVPPFRHLGNFVAFGVVTAFILSVTFLPALLSLLPIRVPGPAQRLDVLMVKLAEFVVRQRKRLFWGGGLTVVLLAASIPRNELNDIFLHYFDESIEFRRDVDFTVQHLTGMYALEYSLDATESGGISDPAYLADLAAFADWYETQPETIHVDVITDTFRQLNKSMHGDDPAAYRLPESRELAAQYLFLYELMLPYGLDLNNQVDADKSATRMVVATRTLSSNEVLALNQRAMQWLADHGPNISRSESSGTTLMFAYLGRRNIISMLVGTTIALVGISFVLIFALRSLRLGLASLIPNLVPGALGFGVWGLTVGDVGVSLSVVTAMTLGIVVDDTVHFLSKYRRARRELGFTSPDAVRHAFQTVGRALLTTSLVLVAGFIVVSVSSFEMNASMGKLTAMVIALALLADFFLLPPLLMKIDRGVGRSGTAGQARRG